MEHRINRLTAVVSALVFTAVSYAASPEPTTVSNETSTVADEAIKDVRYDPFGTPIKPASNVVNVSSQSIELSEPPKKLGDRIADRESMAEPDALSLSPYIVRDLPDRTLARVNEAIAQRRRLETRAFYKRDLTPAVRAEFLSAPEPGSNGPSGKANFPLLRITW